MYTRKAFGVQRPMSPAIRARNVAESILAHQLPLTPATWARYGLGDNPAQQYMVTDLVQRWTRKP